MISFKEIGTKGLVLAGAGAFIIGCGGGGSSSGTENAPAVTEADQTVITTENAPAVVASGSIALELSTGGPETPMMYQQTQFLKKAPLLEKLDTSAANSGQTITQDCPDGGTMSMDSAQASGVLTYTDCRVGSWLLNGSATATSDSTAQSVSITYTNFSITDTEYNEEVFYETLAYQYTVDTTNAQFDLSGSVEMTGYIAKGGVRMFAFKDYTYDYEHKDGTNTFSANGYIWTSCLDSWLQIKTNQPFVMETFADCPSQGQMEIIGNGTSVTMTFNSDGSIDVSGAVEAHYDNCYSMPEMEESCAI